MSLKALFSYFNFKSGLTDFIKPFMAFSYYVNSKCITGLEHHLVSTAKYTEIGKNPEILCFKNI